jgi:hypothetical protein
MNAAQLRKLGFDEAANAAEEQQWQGERARVLVEHVQKSPLDADLCANIADVFAKHAGRVAMTPQRIEDVEPLVEKRMKLYRDYKKENHASTD